MTALEFRTFIKNWINLVHPSIVVIRANENKMRPPLPYISYSVGTRTRQGQSENTNTDGTGDRTSKQHMEAVVSIRGFGKDAEQLMLDLEFSLGQEFVKELLFANCIANRGIANPVTEIPNLVDATIERRWLFEPVFGFATEKTENVSYIGTVEDIMDESTILPPQ